MATGDSMIEGFVSSSGMGWMDLGQGEPEVSADDIAWADSCLNKDSEISENDWSSFKDALLETINKEPDPYTNEKDDFLDDIQYSSKSEVINAAHSKEEEPDSDNSINNGKADDFWSRYNVEDVFLPTYNENLKDLGFPDPEVDLAFQPFELEQSTEDIFKIWDLHIPQEEDLVVKLKKALAESSLKPTTPVSDDSNAWKDLKDVSLDDLVSGIADLSLNPNLG